MWRLVMEGRATLGEIEDGWTVTDVLDANDVLDAWQDAQRRLAEQTK